MTGIGVLACPFRPVWSLQAVVVFSQLIIVAAWADLWRLCANTGCRRPALEIEDPHRCGENDMIRFGAAEGALCIDEAACREICRKRHDCHHIEVSTTMAFCYLKSAACSNLEEWFWDPGRFALVKGSSSSMSCPVNPTSTLVPPATTSTPNLRGSPEGLQVIHTPAPKALPKGGEQPWSVKLRYHTPAPSTFAEQVFQSEPAFPPQAAPTQGAMAKAHWPHHIAPSSRLTRPGDRWFVHIGRRCVAEGIQQDRDLCAQHPERDGFKGSFGSGSHAVCLDVNKCMALCDATEGCFAVEMSQMVNRCELKGLDCLDHDQWRLSTTNLLVVGRLQFPGNPPWRHHHAHGINEAHVANCSPHNAERCPEAWSRAGHPGGFHCLKKLEKQPSWLAYLRSDGACRPASAGPFPYDDCHEQCRIVNAHRYAHCSDHSMQCPQEWTKPGNPGGWHCLQKLVFQHSVEAYLRSNGACRPASAGPFPYDDCHDQCRIGNAGVEDDVGEAWHESPPKEMVVKDAHHVNGLEVLLDASNLLAHSAQALGEVDLERAASTMRFGLAEIDQHEDSDGHSSDGYKYSGILASQSGFSCSLYLVPFNADHVGVFDLASQTLRTVDISVSGEFKYSAGVIYNEVAYFAPYGANHVGIFDLKSEHFGKLAVPSSAECKYSAILSKDSTAYLVPSSSAHVGVLDMARRSFKTISIPDTGIRWKYRGGVLHNGKCYFAPYNADDIGVLDIASEAFHAVDISSTISIDTKFTDAFVRDEVIYFVPFNADGVGALHLESHRFELLQPGNFAAQSFKFWGAIQVGSLTYFVPDNSNAVGVFKADAQEYVEVDISSKISSAFKFATGIFFNGVLYFAPRNAQSIGMLEVGRADRDLCTNRAEAPEAAVAVALPHLSDAADPRSSWDEVWEWPRILEGVVVIFFALLATELTRPTWSEQVGSALQSLLWSIVATMISGLLFFVLRGLLDFGAKPFWVQLWPAAAFFLALWLLFQVSLTMPQRQQQEDGRRLDLVEISGTMASLAAVDAGSALLRECRTCIQAAAALMLLQVFLLGGDVLAGCLARGRRWRADHRSPLPVPLALLSVEVLSLGLLGRLQPEALLNRRGILQDGLGALTPALGFVLLLYSLSCLLFAAAQMLELRQARESRDIAQLAAVWGALRATRWLMKICDFQWPGHRFLFCFVLTATAVLLSRYDSHNSRLASLARSNSAPVLGAALGLHWLSSVLLAVSSQLHLLGFLGAWLHPSPPRVPFAPLWLIVCLLVALLLFKIKARSSGEGTPASRYRRQQQKEFTEYRRQQQKDFDGQEDPESPLGSSPNRFDGQLQEELSEGPQGSPDRYHRQLQRELSESNEGDAARTTDAADGHGTGGLEASPGGSADPSPRRDAEKELHGEGGRHTGEDASRERGDGEGEGR